MSGFSVNANMGNANGVGNAIVVFAASKANPIYGNSENVTPYSYTVRVYICYA